MTQNDDKGNLSRHKAIYETYVTADGKFNSERHVVIYITANKTYFTRSGSYGLDCVETSRVHGKFHPQPLLEMVALHPDAVNRIWHWDQADKAWLADLEPEIRFTRLESKIQAGMDATRATKAKIEDLQKNLARHEANVEAMLKERVKLDEMLGRIARQRIDLINGTIEAGTAITSEYHYDRKFCMLDGHPDKALDGKTANIIRAEPQDWIHAGPKPANMALHIVLTVGFPSSGKPDKEYKIRSEELPGLIDIFRQAGEAHGEGGEDA